ncbi:type II toxin-antitoxin system PemK/MazF family toxin [Ruania rhizosphaerae]|uniref:type II toxin-antitoxin system PemK/MazF family toxin n=1 Tax=Ruania rhizosphaerae TaxID=1840413 RepID=UPI0013589310|nr:type II toxin-antitoxin system PemK/MazF family toxin [Ruania rhizosphaerae]
MIARGSVVWVDFGTPRGSEPAKRRPAVVLQEDWLIESAISTVIVVPMTSNLKLEVFPGNVRIPALASGLDRDSVAVVSQVGPIDRGFLEPHPIGRLPGYLMTQVAGGVRLVTGI